MIALLQRVSQASVEVGTRCVASIGPGLLVLVAIEREDQPTMVTRMVNRIVGYRIFPDTAGKMNLSLRDIDGELLLVPQFTLAADTSKGMRPSFTPAAEPRCGEQLFEKMFETAKATGLPTQAGRFGAEMRVHLINEGPTTFCLRL